MAKKELTLHKCGRISYRSAMYSKWLRKFGSIQSTDFDLLTPESCARLESHFEKHQGWSFSGDAWVNLAIDDGDDPELGGSCR